MISNATGRKYYIHQDSTCSTPNVVYKTYSEKCKNQGAGSTISWKLRLRYYNSYIKNNVRFCQIATHFIDECCDEKIPFNYLAFTSGLTPNQIEDLLLEKEKFWIGTLVTQHQGLNSIRHDWNRYKQTKREKINN